MIDLLRDKTHPITARPRGPLSALRSEAIRPGMLPILVAVLALVSTGRANGQITVSSLLKNEMPDTSADKFPEVARAIERFNDRDSEGAVRLLQEAKKKNPELPPAEMLLAQMWIMENQSRQAQNALEDCTKNNPNDPEAYLVMGDLAFADRRITEAELLFEKAEQLAAGFKENAIRANDFRGRSEAGLAAVAESREQWDTAKKYIENWLKIVEPSDKPPGAGAEPNTRAANAHDRLGRVIFHADPDPTKHQGAADAYKHFQQAVAADSNSIQPDIALAQLYEDADMHVMAKKSIALAVAHPPDDPKAKLATLLAAARWALETGLADDAFNYAKRAYDLDPKSKRALEAKSVMGVAARMKGDTATAERTFEELVTASPGSFLASNQLAQVLAEQKSDPEKQRRALKIASDNEAAAGADHGALRDPARLVESAATLGWVLLMMDRTSEADRMFKAITKAGVASPDVLYFRGRLYQEQGNKKEAISSFTAALASNHKLFVHRDDAQKWLAKLK